MNRGCVLCDGQSFSFVITCPTDRARRFERCDACSLLQVRPMPSEAELYDYYQSYDIMGQEHSYFRALWGEGALDTPEGLELREKAGWITALQPRPRRVLEVGSGHGLFLKLLADAGIEVQGVELSARAADMSRRAHGIPVHQGALDTLPEGKFDVVAMWDLLEHVSDPRRLLAQAAERLTPGGWIFVETPDEAALLDRVVLGLSRVGIAWPANNFYGLHHLVLFRRSTIRRLLEGLGLRVERITPASTYVPRSFPGNGVRDRAARLLLGALFGAARVVDRQNKMIVAARKVAT